MASILFGPEQRGLKNDSKKCRTIDIDGHNWNGYICLFVKKCVAGVTH
ncbi:hypothetical protein LALCM10_160003 [Dellaglioa algida]|nr:hypothetical protein LALCM10_160003 [Dellaglioa algida]